MAKGAHEEIHLCLGGSLVNIDGFGGGCAGLGARVVYMPMVATACDAPGACGGIIYRA